ncbi:hypothetical protein [Kitasatospora sp. NPDC088783]|uniref:hypothetical protein n=1 Tax=Kitasatospora sp. NPDC088783 TaxID=3364077 RepID=UPI00382CA2A5
MVGHRAWDLAHLVHTRAEGGTEAVRALLADAFPDDPELPDRGCRERGSQERPGGPGGVGRMWHGSPGAAG